MDANLRSPKDLLARFETAFPPYPDSPHFTISTVSRPEAETSNPTLSTKESLFSALQGCMRRGSRVSGGVHVHGDERRAKLG
jgi:hypothetical protein